MKRPALLLVLAFAVAAGGLWWIDREGPRADERGSSPESRDRSDSMPATSGAEALQSEGSDSAGGAEPATGPRAGQATPDAAEGSSILGQDPGVTVMPTAIGTGFEALRSRPGEPTLEEAQAAFVERVRGWADELSAEADLAPEHHPVLVELLATWSNERAVAGQSPERQLDLERAARSKFELSVVREMGQDAWDRIEEAIEDEPPWLLDGN
jgi:hypothetical protein